MWSLSFPLWLPCLPAALPLYHGELLSLWNHKPKQTSSISCFWPWRFMLLFHGNKKVTKAHSVFKILGTEPTRDWDPGGRQNLSNILRTVWSFGFSGFFTLGVWVFLSVLSQAPDCLSLDPWLFKHSFPLWAAHGQVLWAGAGFEGMVWGRRGIGGDQSGTAGTFSSIWLLQSPARSHTSMEETFWIPSNTFKRQQLSYSSPLLCKQIFI